MRLPFATARWTNRLALVLIIIIVILNTSGCNVNLLSSHYGHPEVDGGDTCLQQSLIVLSCISLTVTEAEQFYWQNCGEKESSYCVSGR